MSLLYKRKGSPYWYVTKTRESTKQANRKLAEEYARKALVAHWRLHELGDTRRTFAALSVDWLDHKGDAASYAQDKMVSTRFSEMLAELEIEELTDITGDTVKEYAKRVKKDQSASTANRHLTTIRAMLRRARDNEWISKVPTIRAYEIPRPPVRLLSIAEFESICFHLPEWVADLARFAVQTGLRRRNVQCFEWSWIQSGGLVAVVPAVKTKTKRLYTVPLSTPARKILDKYHGVSPKYVFGAPRPLRHWWEQACDKAGLPDVRWHDLRHAWASWHVQNGTPDRILMQIGGWASPRMLENYAHLSTAHLVNYADNINSTQTKASGDLSV